jgi:hypothetical protein
MFYAEQTTSVGIPHLFTGYVQRCNLPAKKLVIRTDDRCSRQRRPICLAGLVDRRDEAQGEHWLRKRQHNDLRITKARYGVLACGNIPSAGQPEGARQDYVEAVAPEPGGRHDVSDARNQRVAKAISC